MFRLKTERSEKCWRTIIYRKQLFFAKEHGLLQLRGLFDIKEFLFLSKIGSIPLHSTPRKKVLLMRENRSIENLLIA